MSKSGFSLQFESSLFFDSQAAASLASGGLLGVAVSGGADSLALLTALLHRFGADRLRVITVNHNMRPEAETAGDAAFVASYCASAGLSCTTVTLERGLVARRARERGKGSEEAARSLRYEAFERFIRQEGLTALCLAHNRNDQLETLVMRFLQGSASGGGIAYRRGPFIRPLLALSRESIERYLKEQGLSWRTDATNADTRYLRNAIRRQLLPMLDRLYPGWDGAVLSGAEKAGEDDAVLEALASSFSWEKAPDGSCCTMPASVFYGQSPALRRRLFYRALTDLGFDKRFPYGLVRAACSSDFFSVEGAAPRGGRELTAMGITFGIKKEMLFVKKEQNRATESGFLGILSAVGETCTLFDRIFSAAPSPLDDGLCLLCAGGKGQPLLPVCRARLPLCIRSALPGDQVQAADGSSRSLSGLFSAWHVESGLRQEVPVAQELSEPGQPLVCVLGSFAGAPDWIVNGRKL